MSSMVIYSKSCVVAEWNKSAPFSVMIEGRTPRTYPTAKAAIMAARLAAMKQEG